MDKKMEWDDISEKLKGAQRTKRSVSIFPPDKPDHRPPAQIKLKPRPEEPVTGQVQGVNDREKKATIFIPNKGPKTFSDADIGRVELWHSS